MSICKFCQKDFEPKKLGGHTVYCYSNPTREKTREKIRQSRAGCSLSDETKQKLSMTITQKVIDGTWHNSFSRCRKQEYKGQSFDGKWEVLLAKWFDENQITWTRNKRRFPYIFGKLRHYVPDFYLADIDCYVEVKGWKTLKDEAKWAQFPLRLVILSGSDLQALGLHISVRKDWKI